MRRLRPSLVTSTWRTLGGKATGFGKRTAWLRLVVKTVERVILPLHFWYIPKGYTFCLSARQHGFIEQRRMASRREANPERG
jgi:hypothetical protein